MGLPMFPRPIKPTGVFEAIDRVDTGKNTTKVNAFVLFFKCEDIGLAEVPNNE